MPAPSLRAQRLSLAFGDRRLFDGATFHLAPGWTGLVGPNGAGKTTLLEVLAGLRPSDSGQVSVTPEGLSVVLCPQRVDEPSAEVQALAARLRRGWPSVERARLVVPRAGREGAELRTNSCTAEGRADAAAMAPPPSSEWRDEPHPAEPRARSADTVVASAPRRGPEWTLAQVLRLEPDQLSRWDTLSPGERKRWQIGGALASRPGVLLLDEPTNHLDLDARAWLREALTTFRGIGVLVSHDRGLLDDLTGATLKLEHGELRHRPQAFSAAREAWAAEEVALRASQREAQRQLEHQARALDEARRRHEASVRSRHAGARMRDRHDSDARGMQADYRAATAEAAHAATLRRNRARADEVQARLASLTVRDALARPLFLRDEPCPRPVVVALAGEVPRADGAPLLMGVSLQVRRGEHVRLAGPNGAGKTTLLAALLTRAALPPERVLHLPQELTPDDAAEDLERLAQLPRDEKGRVLQVVAALGVDPEAVLATRAPSPGEARKLRLALGLGRCAWLAALDEPTNHLDLPSIERLQDALAAFPGALVLVTHDEALAQRVTTRRVEVRGGAVEG